jgi:hypothetical protein
MGAFDGGSDSSLIIRWNNGFSYNNLNETLYTALYTNADTHGFYVANRNATNLEQGWKNGIKKIEVVNIPTTRTNKNVYLGAFNNNTVPLYFDNKQTAFASIGDGLTDDDSTNFYYSTQVFQTTLGRQIGSPAYALPAVNDVNAKLYLSAINSSDPTVNGAVDTFISGLKTDGIYSKMKAVYPFVTDNVNLLSYTEDFGNGYWQKQNTSAITNATIAPNGTLTANKLNENGANGYHSFSFPTGVITTTNPYTCSFYAKAAERTWCSVYLYDGTAYEAFFDLVNGVVGSVASGMTATITNVDNGWYRCTVTRSVTITASTNGGIISAIGNNQSNYTGTSGSGIYVWGAQLQESSTATTYQPQLGSAQSYFANQFKYNMINPQDDDSAFRLVFNGGWTHSPQGATPNGVNGYADTKLNPSLAMTLNSTSMSVYSRTNNALDIVDFGVSDAAVNRMLMAIKWSNNDSYYDMYNNTTNRITYTMGSSSSSGLFIANRSNNVVFNIWKNNTKLTTNTNTQLVNLPNKILFIGANNSTVIENYSTRQYAFAHVADGLNDTEAANLYSRVQNLQTLLNRAVI